MKQIKYVQHKLNNRPRKKLGFLTPNEFLSINLHKQKVAFITLIQLIIKKCENYLFIYHFLFV